MMTKTTIFRKPLAGQGHKTILRLNWYLYSFTNITPNTGLKFLTNQFWIVKMKFGGFVKQNRYDVLQTVTGAL